MLNNCGSSWNSGTCNCCGSITITDAIKYLKMSGTSYSGSDWKYGYPHKFYISPVNPNAEDVVEIGRDYNAKAGDPDAQLDGFSWYRPIMGTRSLLHNKFYTNHVLDGSPEEFKEFNDLSAKYFGISFERDVKGLKYTAPHANFQKFGIIT